MVNNGVLVFDDLLHGGDVRLEPHSTDLFVTAKADYSYDEAAVCPRIDEFLLHMAGGDLELAQLPVDWVAYGILKACSTRNS